MPDIQYPWLSVLSFVLAVVASACFVYFARTLAQAEGSNRLGQLLIDGCVLGIGWSGAVLLAVLAFFAPATIPAERDSGLFSIVPAIACATLALYLITLSPAFRRTVGAAALLVAGALLTPLVGALTADAGRTWVGAPEGLALAVLPAFAMMLPAVALLAQRPPALWQSGLATLLLAVGWLLPPLLGPAYWPMTGRNAAMASPMEAAVLTALDALTVISLVLLGRWLIGRTEGGPAGELAELRAANTNLATRLHEAESHAAEHNSALQEVVTKMGETQRFRETLQQLTELLQLCESETESEQIIVQGGPQLFPRWSGALTFADDGGLMMVAASWGHPFTAQQSTEVDCWAVRRGRLHQSSIDPEQHALSPVCSHFGGDGALPPGIKAIFCAPLLKSFDRPGVLHLVAYETMNEEDMQAAAWRAETFADALKLSLGNLRLRTSLREQAVHDEMTELFNRRHFDEVLNRELSRSQRTGEGLILAILDIDHFKNFNDNYGHEAGDEVLKKVAEHLRRFVRAYDIACRVGGEELGIIMPRVHMDEAFTRLNQLRKEIGACVLTYKGTRLPAVTVSVGIAELDSGTPDDLLRRADTAMYAAKNSGRNRVIRWSPELDADSPASVGQNAEAAPAATGSTDLTEAESVPQENQAGPTAVGQDSAQEGIKRRLDSSNRGVLPE